MTADERVIPGVTSVNNLQKHIARYNLILDAVSNKTVLDLACGTGYGSWLMAQVADYVVGVDINEDAIEFAINHYLDNNLEYDCRDILKYESTKPVDVVISLETVEHIKNLEALEKKFLTLLKPGGKLIYSVPLYENYSNPYHVHKFDLDSGLKLFPSFKTLNYVIQENLNFSQVDNKKPFTYLVVAKKK
jgi:2-polyprenyl-3-methyl-5-hydroxy-6-metoxy-1,4-benzoquinol methylase